MVVKTDRELLESIADDVSSVKRRLSRLEREELSSERRLQHDEEEELDDLARLEKLEQEIKKDVSPHPLTRITYRDVTKGIIGSFFGIVGHFAFFYGEKIAYDLTVWRAHTLFLTSLIILVLFMYFSGFRQVRKNTKHHYLLWRVAVIFLVAHAVIAFVLTLFGRIELSMGFVDIYKNIAAVSILAVMGAATADLIGGEAE